MPVESGSSMRKASMRHSSSSIDCSTLKWKDLTGQEFGEIVANIIVSPVATLASLGSVLIRKEDDGLTLLHVVSGLQNGTELVNFLLQEGIPPNVRDSAGWTPLLEAAQEGQIETCQLLLSRGALPDLGTNIKNSNITPLRAAAEVGNDQMTRWLLKQPGTWSGKWDNELFAFLLTKTPGAACDYMDFFASTMSHSRRGYIAVKYTDLHYVYGEPTVSVEQTALNRAAESSNAREVLSHRLMRYIMRAKWKGFARGMFRREFSAYMILLFSYFIPTIWADPDWVLLTSSKNYLVAFSRGISWICSIYLLFYVEKREFQGSGVRKYFFSFWNWLHLITYFLTIATIPIEFIGHLQQVRNSVLALIIVSLWVNLLQFLQVSTESGLLIAMMGHMIKDVYRFFLLCGIFLLGFSGAFYTLLKPPHSSVVEQEQQQQQQQQQNGFGSFLESFVTVYLMIYGNLDYTTFNDDKLGVWRWNTANILLFIYLMSVVIVLLNILIAMMATTYSEVWEAAEAEALQSHAQAIIRMERTMEQKQRKEVYQKLLTCDEISSNMKKKKKTLRKASRVVADARNKLKDRFQAKKELFEVIKKKILPPIFPINNENFLGKGKQMVTFVDKGAELVTQKLAKIPQTISFRQRGTTSTTTEKSSLQVEDFEYEQSTQCSNTNSPTIADITNAQEANDEHVSEEMILPFHRNDLDLDLDVDLDALEESFFLKSGLDEEDERGPDGVTNTLPLLADGIRYEMPQKKKHHADTKVMVAELQEQVGALKKTIEELQKMMKTKEQQEEIRGNSSNVTGGSSYRIPHSQISMRLNLTDAVQLFRQKSKPTTLPIN